MKQIFFFYSNFFAVCIQRLFFVWGVLALTSPLSLAQPYPNKPIKLIVPFGAGGAVDVVGRIIANDLTTRLGQSVVVENKTGAGGNLAASFASFIAQQSADY